MRSAKISLDVSVKGLVLIWFIYMATSKPFVDTPMAHSSCSFLGFRLKVQEPTDSKKKKKPSGHREGRMGVRVKGVVLGNQNDRQR